MISGLLLLISMKGDIVSILKVMYKNAREYASILNEASVASGGV